MKEPEIPGIIIAIAAIASPTNIMIALYNENPGVICVSGFSDLNITINIIIASEIAQQMIDDIGIFFDGVCCICCICSNCCVCCVCCGSGGCIGSGVCFFAFSQWVKIIGMLPKIIPMKNQFV